MPDTPPRRSRRPPPGDTAGALPIVPIVIGMIVVGFIIGAGLSMAGKRARQTVAIATPVAQVSPLAPSVTLAPTERPTSVPAPTSSPQPGASAPAEVPTSQPSITRATTAASASALPAVRRSPRPAAASAATPGPAVTGAPATAQPTLTVRPVTVAVHRPPSPPPVIKVTGARASSAPVAAAPTNAPPSTDDTDSDFGKLAANVVRAYLDAVGRGDTAAATAALVSPSEPLAEAGVVDGSTRIKHLEAHTAGDAATVNVDLQSAGGGRFFGQYTVRRSSSGAALIVSHSIIKP